MHIVIVAAILSAFLSGFFEPADIPDKQMNLASFSAPGVRFREEIIPKEDFIYKNIIQQEHDFSCGSAALSTLLTHGLGENLSEKQVIRGMLKHGNKEQIKKLRAFSLLDMKQLCKVLGYDASGYRAEFKDIENPDYWPCIVPIKLFDYRHFVVLKGVHDGHVFLADPFRGNISYSRGQFEDAWYENVLFMVSSDKFKTAAVNMLRLTNDDLVYVTDDISWDILKNRPVPFSFPVYFERDDIPGEKQFYRP